MSQRAVHILHLTEQWLRWATIEPGAAPVLKDVGEARGEAARTLENWARQHGDRRASIRLYDARPRYLTFTQRVPLRALAQKDNLVKLRLRQELGMGEEALLWSAVTEPVAEDATQADLITIVARRDALADVIEWRQRYELSGLWVGAEISAIRRLLGQGSAAPGRTMIVNSDHEQATLYQLDNAQQVMKSAVQAQVKLADLGWHAPAARAHFMANGGDGGDRFARGAPDLALVPEIHPSLWAGRYPAIATRVQELDAVLLGGILEQESGGRAAMPSLLPDAKRQLPTGRVAERFTVRQLVMGIVIGVGLLGAAGWFVHRANAGALSELDARNAQLRSQLVAYRSQDGLLRRIKSDRKPTLPVFQAVLEATPQGMTFDSVQIGESGLLQITGATQSTDTVGQLVKNLALSTLLERVVQGNFRPDTRGRGQTFEVTAHVKGWGR